MNHLSRRFATFLVGLVLAALLSLPVAAQVSLILIDPLWQPGEQLTSISGDTRFVELQLYVQGNVQFWAVDLTCSIGTGAELLNPVITWGPEWGTKNADFYEYLPANNYQFGSLKASATRIGADKTPMGLNGADYDMLLLTIKFEVGDLAFNTTIYPYCSAPTFLNRNGEILVYGLQYNYDPLTITVGYNIRGKVVRQGYFAHTNIEVACLNIASNTTYTTFTDYFGNFSFGGAFFKTANPLRDKGLYRCTFTSKANGTTEDALYLQERAEIDLQTADYYLLPIKLKAGDVNRGAGEVNLVDNDDLAMLTANWSGFTYVAPYATGDATGDGYINQNDLAVVSGNVGRNDSTPPAYGHVIYGLARDLNGTFPNSRLWWGDRAAGEVQTALLSFNRDFWPAVSPDGSTMVFTRIDYLGRHHLYRSSLEFPAGVQFTPAIFSREAFAPAWSTDGKRIGFICSWKDAISGYEYNEGDVCVLNTSDLYGNSLAVAREDAKLYPPAWFNANMFIYAGSPANTVCPNRLCYYDFTTNTGGLVTIGGLNANDRVDMPVVANYNGTNYLFYRYYNNASQVYNVRVGKITYTSGVIGGGVTAALSNGSHENVDNTTGADYYVVSPTLDVMYYLFNTYTFKNVLNQNLPMTGDFSWSSATNHIVDGFLGNPNAIVGSSVLWDGNLNNPTLLHAYRATMDWLP
jgi:hypothetical protein